MRNKKKKQTADNRIISENCITLGGTLFLFKIDKTPTVTELWVGREGVDTAYRIMTEQMRDSSIIKVLELMDDASFIDQIQQTIINNLIFSGEYLEVTDGAYTIHRYDHE